MRIPWFKSSRKKADAPRPEANAQATADSASGPTPEAGRSSAPTPWIAVLLIAASLAMVLWHLQPTSKKNSNTGSRYATVEALIDYGTFAIDKSRYKFTIDKVKIEQEYYSTKPPLLAVYTAGTYWVYQKITGKTFKKNEEDSVQWCGFWTGWLSHFVTLVYFYLLARRLFRNDLAVLAALAAACFAYLGAGFATAINNHTVAAAIALGGLYHAYRARTDPLRKFRHWIGAGLWLGFLPGLDLPCTVICVAIGVYLLSHDWKRTLLLFAPAALPGLICHFSLTYLATGSVWPVYLRSELYQYAGSYWSRRGGIDALQEPKHIYAFHLLLGHHGLFSMTPLFIFSLFGLGRSLRRGAPLRREAFTLAAVLAVLLAFYIFRTRNYGGWSVGVRWLIPVMPPLLLFFGAWVETAVLRAYKWVLVVLAFGVGAYHTQDAISGPFQYSRWQNWIENTPGRARTDELHKKDDLDQQPPRPRRERRRR